MSKLKPRGHCVPPASFQVGEHKGELCCQYQDCSQLAVKLVNGADGYEAAHVCADHVAPVIRVGDKVTTIEHPDKPCPLVPLNGFVILRRFKEEEYTPGGLIRPQTQQTPLDKGRVVAVGGQFESDFRTVPHPDIKVGDVVHFSAGGGVEIKAGETVYFTLPARVIVCVEKNVCVEKKADE